MANKWDIDYWVEGRVRSMVKSFYPTIVARDTDLPLPIVFERLLEMYQDEKLDLKWEIRCPDCHYTLETLDTFPLINDNDIFYCNFEEENKELTVDNVYPVFEISPDYRKAVRGKNIQSQKKKTLRDKQILAHQL